MKKFKSITNEELESMSGEQKLMAVSGVHQALLNRFRPEVQLVINQAITTAAELGRDQREAILMIGSNDDQFFTPEVREAWGMIGERWQNNYNVFWMWREQLASSPPAQDSKHPYNSSWNEALRPSEAGGFKCLVVSLLAASVIEIVPAETKINVDMIEGGVEILGTD